MLHIRHTRLTEYWAHAGDKYLQTYIADNQRFFGPTFLPDKYLLKYLTTQNRNSNYLKNLLEKTSLSCTLNLGPCMIQKLGSVFIVKTRQRSDRMTSQSQGISSQVYVCVDNTYKPAFRSAITSIWRKLTLLVGFTTPSSKMNCCACKQMTTVPTTSHTDQLQNMDKVRTLRFLWCTQGQGSTSLLKKKKKKENSKNSKS